jgi:hypothetical protein
VGHIPGPGPRVQATRALWDQNIDRLADQILTPVPEQLLRLAIGQGDPAAGRHAQYRVWSRLQQCDGNVVIRVPHVHHLG